MNTDWALLKIRCHQWRWEIKHLGIFNVLILALILLLQFLCFDSFQRMPDTWLALGLAWGALLSFHFTRQDLAFVYFYLERPIQALCWEYGAYSMIFCWPALLTPHWYAFFLLMMGAMGIACSRPYKKERTPLRHLGYVLAAAQFEWISGIRRYYPMLIGLYLVALILSWVRVLPWFYCGY